MGQAAFNYANFYLLASISAHSKTAQPTFCDRRLGGYLGYSAKTFLLAFDAFKLSYSLSKALNDARQFKNSWQFFFYGAYMAG